jgi:chromosome segregation ATPase
MIYSAAEIVVRLKNQGEDAYRPDLYGKTICIERRILRDGTSTYRLRNGETNAVISTKREELMAICDHMGIQLDNPMNVLSQETAKAFLSSSKPEDKYEVGLQRNKDMIEANQYFAPYLTFI